MTNIKIKLILVVLSFSILSYAQQSDKLKRVLKGLKKATPQDLMSLSGGIQIDKYDTYDLKGDLISIKDHMNDLMEGKKAPHFYLGSDGKIKLVVLRDATEQERKQMEEQMKQARNMKTKLKGKSAPEFSVTTIDGNKWDTASLKGKTVVLNFWFIACKPCIDEIPDLNKLVDKYSKKNVVFLGLGLDSKSQVNDFLKTQKFEYQIVPKSQIVVKNFKVMAFPTHIVVDPKGKVVFETTGLAPNTIQNIDDAIESTLK